MPIFHLAMLLVLLVALPAHAQSPGAAKEKRKRFGESLKRLKWDSKRSRAIEASRPRASSDARDGGREGDGPRRTGDDVIKLSTTLALFDVLVTDSTGSRFIGGLGRDDFVVAEDGQRQQIAFFARGDDASLPRSIILLLDHSGSQAAYLRSSIEAAKALVAQLSPLDEMAIVTDDVELLADFTRDKARLAAVLDGLAKEALSPRGERKRRGRSLQFTALFACLRELVNDEQKRPIIIFQSDGDEAGTFRDQPFASDYVWNRPRREYGLADIYSAASRSRATIYSVIPGARLMGLVPDLLYERGRRMLEEGERARLAGEGPSGREGARPLSDAQVKLFSERFAMSQAAAARVAELTGGWTVFFEEPGQAASIYSRILSDINNRYSIGYYPTGAARDGKWRDVRVEVRGHPDYRVSGRAGYFAPSEP
jgi:VWFA-related protein